MKGLLESLNPFWKGLTVVVCALLLSLSYSVALNLALFLVCMALLFCCSGARKRTALCLLLPVLLLAAGMLVTGLLYSDPAAAGVEAGMGAGPVSIGSLANGLQLATRLFAFAGLGLLFSLTTGANEFIGSLQHQARLPAKFAYGVLAAAHLLPNLRREYGNAKTALRARGLRVHAFSARPLFLMLINAVLWSQALAMAMESKGFDGDAPRTSYRVPAVRRRDYAFFACGVGLTALGMAVLRV